VRSRAKGTVWCRQLSSAERILDRSSGRVWSVRPATSGDAHLLAAVVGSSTQIEAREVQSQLSSCDRIRALFRNDVAVGLCGVEGLTDTVDPWRQIEFRIVVLVAGELLDDAAASEAADRLLRELAQMLDVPMAAQLRSSI
jgi:hypothetical protein